MSKGAAKTGVQPTALVAMEQCFKPAERIIHDEWAYKMLSAPMRVLVDCMKCKPVRDWMVAASEKAIPGSWAGILCRKLYIDEKLTDYAENVQAVVNLGAGFDTRIFRLSMLEKLPVWELDQCDNIVAKQHRLKKVLSVPQNLKLVTIDFDNETINSALMKHGYNFKLATFFILEAVTQYLTENGLRDLFIFLSKAKKGSLLAFTYITGDFMTGRELCGADLAYNQYVVKRKLWLCGKNANEWEEFLKGYGYAVIEHSDLQAMTQKYIKPTGRNLTILPIERIILARKEE